MGKSLAGCSDILSKINNSCYNRAGGDLCGSINLGPTFEDYVQQKVAEGVYASVSEVIREALRLMQQQDAEREAKIAWLRELRF